MKVIIEKGMDISEVGPRFQFLFNELIKEYGATSVGNVTMYFDVYLKGGGKLDTKSEVLIYELAENHKGEQRNSEGD